MLSTRTNPSRLKALAKSLGLLVILLLIPYRIASGTSPSAVHTWIMSLFWQIHFDQVSTTFHSTIQETLLIAFVIIILPALYFHFSLQTRSDGTFSKIPIILSILYPVILDYLITTEEELYLPFSLSRYEWQSLYAFSIVALVTMIVLPLLVNLIPKGTSQRPKIEAIIVAITTFVIPSVAVGLGRMYSHYTYTEMILYGPLWSLLIWERSGAFYGYNEFVLEFHMIPRLVIALCSSFFNLLFIFLLFHNYGTVNTRKRTLMIGIIGIVTMLLSYYLIEFYSSDIQRVYVFAFPLPITLILGLLIMKFSYPKYELSTKPEDIDMETDVSQQVESEDVVEISIIYRFLSWLRRRG